MRYWPTAAAGGVRTVPEDMILYNGKMMLPKGTICLLAPFAFQRERDVFEHADEWLPNRWENPTKAMKDAFMPFMVGRRACPGQLLASTETEVFLVRLVCDYEWSVIQQGLPENIVILKNAGTILCAEKLN